MKEKITAWMDEHPTIVSDYETGNFPQAERVKDLQKRFCFDMAWYAELNPFFCKLYRTEDVNDDHIYTALKRICPKVTKKY